MHSTLKKITSIKHSVAASFLWVVSVPFMAGMTLTRLVLWLYAVAADQVETGIVSSLQIFALGVLNDMAALAFVAAVFSVLSLVWPRALWRSRMGLPLAGLFYLLLIGMLIFSAVAELAFWDEFSNRFNFIAVDYLVYTHEVLDNIIQSYPMGWLLMGVGLLAGLVTWMLWAFIQRRVASTRPYRHRALEAIVLVIVACGVYFGIHANSININQDHYQTELSKNGWYSLFSAFWHNTLSYEQFYKTLPQDEALSIFHQLLKESGDPVSASAQDGSIARPVLVKNPDSKPNVVLITVESLSAEFMAQYGQHHWMPHLDALVPQSLVFNQYYATGNRTVRGLEAEAMGVPPTPGNSIVRRPHNENLYTIGSVLKPHGYQNKFIYGGYGYFDNMNSFFSHNNFDIVDQSDMSQKEVTFSNAWGVADENLLDRTLTEADKTYAAGQPFFSLVMTTSNHRPYTYPEGRVKVPSGTGREGAVQYTDWVIWRFLEQAKTKPWFNNTIFIITGDHCASSAGHTELPIEKYHIPLLVYAPQLVKPRQVNHIVSQMDLAPTIMELLKLPYTNRFFGSSALTLKKERALIATYQSLGYYTPGNLVVLQPNRKVLAYSVDKEGVQTPVTPNLRLVNEAISYYQTAYTLFSKGKMAQ